jgi:hypothetical protein
MKKMQSMKVSGRIYDRFFHAGLVLSVYLVAGIMYVLD